MQKYISFLRGINVGGHRRILMTELKAMFIEVGFENPKTYIQSGNVIFESSLIDSKEIEESISKAILSKFGHEVPVSVRTVEDLRKTITDNPFYSDSIDTKKLHIMFLSDIPLKKDILTTQNVNFGSDQFLIQGNRIYLFIENQYHKTKLSNLFFEKKLKISTTTRNWKTVKKMLELSLQNSSIQ